jgi:hypothetical protein
MLDGRRGRHETRQRVRGHVEKLPQRHIRVLCPAAQELLEVRSFERGTAGHVAPEEGAGVLAAGFNVDGHAGDDVEGGMRHVVRDDHRGVEAWVCGLHFGGHEGAGGEELLGDEGDGVLDMVVGCGDCAWEVVGMYL